jgi:hypothetical protein
MPVKTNFLKLNKIQENEYYSTDIENQNLDKIDESIKGYDLKISTIEDTVNKKEKLEINLSSNQQAESVKDTFGGQCDFEIEGMLLDQLIENGDFEDNIKGWSLGESYLGNISAHAKAVWDSGKLKITGNPNATATYIMPWNKPFKTVLNQKYFLYTQMKSDNLECTGFDIGLYKDGGNLIGDKIIATESSPVADKWYEVYGIVTASQHTDKECFCLPVARYSAAGKPIANKSIYYEKVMCLPIQSEDLNLTANQLKVKYVDNGYFEGLKPLQGICIEGTGKNYISVQSFTLENKIYNTLIQGYFKLKRNTYYTLYAKVRDGSGRITVSNGISLHAVNETSRGNKLTFNTGDNGNWSYWFTNDSAGDTPTIYDILLVEGTEAPKFYIPHISSKVSFKDALAKLPNGVRDKISRANEKTVKYAYTNVGKDGVTYKLKKADILYMDTSYPLVDRIVLSSEKFDNYLQGNAVNDNAIMSKFKQISSNESSGNKNDINTFYFTPKKSMRITVAKNKYANIEEAKEDLQGTPLVYELENPQYIELASKTEFLNSYHDYTAFSVWDGFIKDEHIPIKYNGVTGFWTNDVNPNSPQTYSPWHYKVKYIIDLVELLPDGSKRSVLNFFTMNLNSTHSYGYLRGYFPEEAVKKQGININNIYATYKTSETNNQGNVKIIYSADMSSSILGNTNAINTVGRQIDNLATKTHQTANEYEKRTSTIEEKLNKRDSLELELSPLKNIKSVTDSYGGACGFEVEGALVEQLVKNGDLSNGIDGWSGVSSSISISGDTLQMTNNSANDNIVRTPTHKILSAGTYVYTYAKVRVTDSDSTALVVQNYLDGSYKHTYIQQSNPISNKWYEIHDKNLLTDAVDHARIRARYSGGGRGKVCEVEKIVRFIITEEEFNQLTTDELKDKYVDNFYFEGLQPLRGLAIEAIGKNLFDKDTVSVDFVLQPDGTTLKTGGASSSDYIRISDNKTYTISDFSDINMRVCYYDIGFNFISAELTAGVDPFNFTIPNRTVYTRFSFEREKVDTVQLEEGISATTYTPYKSSKLVFEDALAKLPNGAADKIVRENGKTVKFVNTNVGRDFSFLKLASSNVSSLSKSFNEQGLQILRYNLPLDYIGGKFGMLDNSVVIENLTEVANGRDVNAVNKFWIVDTFFSSNEKAIYIGYPKDTFSDIDDAKSKANTLKIVYQLETAETIDLLNKTESLNSYDNYTQFCVEDGVVEDERVTIKKGINPIYMHINSLSLGTELSHKVKTINDVTFDGKSIFNMGDIATDVDAYGSQRWRILTTVVESNNIDINQIYVTYTTSESNGQANAKIKYNADMSSVVSSNANALNIVGEQVDKLTDRLTGKLIWQEPDLKNDWVKYEEPHGGIKYAKTNDGMVHLMGMAKDGKDNKKIFELPKKYRPKNTLFMPIVTYGDKMARCKINQNGEVEVSNSNSTWVSFSGVSYYVGG